MLSKVSKSIRPTSLYCLIWLAKPLIYSPTKIVRIVKSITVKEIFKRRPEVKEKLWGGESWTAGYFISSVGKNRNETAIMKYVKN